MNPNSSPTTSTLKIPPVPARIVSAAIGLPLLILIVWVGSPWFTLLVGVAAAIAALELSNLARLWGDRPMTLLAVASAVALVAIAHILASSYSDGARVPLIVPIAAGVSIVWLMWHAWPETRPSALLATAGVALYTGGLLFHAPMLRALDQGREWVLLLLIATFAADTCAFLFGRAVGRNPLAPSISPSKTWEGAAGSVAGALGASVAAVYILDLDAGVGEALALGALIGTVGQLGDLTISRLKRMAGTKESGYLVPGHGGVLDRLDSIVFNLVVVYYFVSY